MPLVVLTIVCSVPVKYMYVVVGVAVNVYVWA